MFGGGNRVTYVVVVADRIADSGFALLNREQDIEVVSTAGDGDRLKEEIKRANGLIVRSDTQVTVDLMADAKELQVIGRAGVGVDNVDVAAATQRGIAVLNAPGANTVSAAEHAIGLLLANLRRISPAVSSMRAGKWARKEFPGTEMRGKVLGLVGLGRIGRHVATIARAFGMQIIAHDPYLPEARALELGIELVPVDELLGRADVISLHIPLTDDTRHFLNRDRIAQMKDSAVVVNTARGALIDDVALVAALDAGKLGGAALDVFDPEPLPEDSPLRSNEKITLTPHLAASTSEAQERVAIEICTAIRDALLTGSVGGAVNLPGISGKALVRLAGVMELSRRMGRLAAALANGRIRSVAVAYGGDDEAAPRPVMLAALEGVLTANAVDQVSIVNAAVLAEERGMKVSRKVTSPLAGFSTTIGVKVEGQTRYHECDWRDGGRTPGPRHRGERIRCRCPGRWPCAGTSESGRSRRDRSRRDVTGRSGDQHLLVPSIARWCRVARSARRHCGRSTTGFGGRNHTCRAARRARGDRRQLEWRSRRQLVRASGIDICTSRHRVATTPPWWKPSGVSGGPSAGPTR